MAHREIMVVGTARTAIGSFGGALKEVPLTTLGTTVVRAAMEHAGVAPQEVGHVVMGNVIPTEARYAYLSRVPAMDAGIPKETPAFKVNRLCGSGLPLPPSGRKHGHGGRCRPRGWCSVVPASHWSLCVSAAVRASRPFLNVPERMGAEGSR